MKIDLTQKSSADRLSIFFGQNSSKLRGASAKFDLVLTHCVELIFQSVYSIFEIAINIKFKLKQITKDHALITLKCDSGQN